MAAGSVKSVVRTEIGPLSNFGVRTKLPFAFVKNIPKHWKKFKNKSDVQYAAYLGGAILYSNPDLQDMPESAVSIVSGKWKTCIHPEYKKKFMFAYDMTPGVIAKITGLVELPTAPNFILTIGRMVAVHQDADAKNQEWEFTFGAGYTLKIKRFEPARLLRNGEEIAKHDVEESEKREYAFGMTQRWEIANIGGSLYIRSNHFRDPWIISGVGDLPRAVWSFQGNGGQYWANVSRVTFKTSGYFETGRINHYELYPDDAAVFKAWGTAPTGCTISIGVIESGYAQGETWKRYRVELTSLDGSNTPYVQNIAVEFDPTYSEKTDIWSVFSEHVSSITEDLSEDMATRKTTINVSLYKRIGGQTFRQRFGNLRGEHAVRIAAGYQYRESGLEVVEDRMVGIMSAQDQSATPRSVRLQMTCYDRWTKLDEKRTFCAPPLTGLWLHDAIAKMAVWYGIHPDDIVAEPIPILVAGPDATSTGEIPWVPQNGAKPTEVIRQLCALGAIAEFWEDGKLHIYAADPTDVKATFSTEEGTDPAFALSTLTWTQDLAGKVNHILVEGGTEDDPIFASMWHFDSIYTEGSDTYKGDAATEYIKNENLPDITSVNRACYEAYVNRPAGWVSLKATSKKGWGACHLWPRYRVTVRDFYWTPTNEALGKVKQMSVSYGRGAPRISMTVEGLGNE